MIRSLCSFLLCLAAFTGSAQQYADTLVTRSGPWVIHPLSHATFVMTVNGKTIYVDPTGGAEAFTAMNPPDIILITDIHFDHHDQKTLDAVKAAGTRFVVPKAVADKMPPADKNKLVVLANGNTTRLGEIGITAVPMYNLPETDTAMHTRGRGNGYLVRFGGKTIYISGDTEDIPEMRKLKNIDAAFVCMNLPYTMDINQAADAVNTFRPKIVYPYHYRGKNGLSDVGTFKKLVNAKNPGIDVRVLNWYPEQTANPAYNKALADSLGADANGMRPYVLAILKTGTNATTDKTKLQELFKGHMANINRLAENRQLVVAGPLQKNERTYRGLFILNVKTVDEARRLVESDPAVQEKIFDVELFQWYGSAALPAYLDVHRQITREVE